MTDEEIVQLARNLNPDEKTRLIQILCGSEESWNEADGEFVMKLYRIKTGNSAVAAKALADYVVQEMRQCGEEVPQPLLDMLARLEKKAENSLRNKQRQNSVVRRK